MYLYSPCNENDEKQEQRIESSSITLEFRDTKIMYFPGWRRERRVNWSKHKWQRMCIERRNECTVQYTRRNGNRKKEKNWIQCRKHYQKMDESRCVPFIIYRKSHGFVFIFKLLAVFYVDPSYSSSCFLFCRMNEKLLKRI